MATFFGIILFVINILDVTNIQNIPDNEFEDVSQHFHHSHFLDHCDSPGDLFLTPRLRMTNLITITVPDPRISVMKVFW